jgi:indole-3-glycerol phosphate synthase
MSTDFLAAMAASSRARALKARASLPESELRARLADCPAAPPLTLSGQFDLIAEVKLRSPAAGALKTQDEDVSVRVCDYAQAGAAAISVLTEPSRFDGSMQHLQQAAAALRGQVPAMRKDFLVDPYQAMEARAVGAGGILIILRMLEPAVLRSLIESCVQFKLFGLLEAFDEADLRLASELVREYRSQGQFLVGINCRDLVTLKVVPGRLEALAPLLPTGIRHVAESGVATAADAERLVRCGYDMALVGSALMQAEDPLQLARSMLGAGRAVAMRPCG